MGAGLPVLFAQSAESDLVEILEWYAEQDAPQVGRRLVERVIAQMEQLSSFPDSGRMVPEFEMTWLRELELPPFRIVYRRDEAAVTVVRVWRSERLMDPDLGRNG